ncbi:hypothetical protein [Shewanella sp. NIFS-20-20]|uniref:hypothetical protein n=1 Tax=Shewanella sp. NIFS-20-20 TaxID=2853806 RepID=UPI001C46157C|nr:hypothetical protein [Shewanella sp. NIFS-20-20]MBV7317307.1 hypothetical protein [Shewanella sp. NIFS-20-20]
MLTWRQVKQMMTSTALNHGAPAFVAVDYCLLHPDGEFHSYFVGAAGGGEIRLLFCAGSLDEVLSVEMMQGSAEALVVWFAELKQCRFIDVRHQAIACHTGVSPIDDWQACEQLPILALLAQLVPERAYAGHGKLTAAHYNQAVALIAALSQSAPLLPS